MHHFYKDILKMISAPYFHGKQSFRFPILMEDGHFVTNIAENKEITCDC